MDEQSSTKAATVALILGILGWLAFIGSYRRSNIGDALYYQPFTTLAPVLLPLSAIVSGHIGLRNGSVSRRGRSITALALGYSLLILEVARFVAA